MFYQTQTGKSVQIFNRRPRNLSRGGLIKDSPKIRDKKEDTVSSWLEYGSLVVPVSVVGALHDYHGEMMGAVQHDKAKLGKTIVMPGEYVVHKKYAKKVEAFLKKKGIVLPLPH